MCIYLSWIIYILSRFSPFVPGGRVEDDLIPAFYVDNPEPYTCNCRFPLSLKHGRWVGGHAPSPSRLQTEEEKEAEGKWLICLQLKSLIKILLWSLINKIIRAWACLTLMTSRATLSSNWWSMVVIIKPVYSSGYSWARDISTGNEPLTGLGQPSCRGSPDQV